MLQSKNNFILTIFEKRRKHARNKGWVAVITGGACSIGLALAKHWVKNGDKVVLADVSAEGLEKAALEIEGNLVTVICNVSMRQLQLIFET